MLHRDNKLLPDRDVKQLSTKCAAGQWVKLGHEVITDLRPSLVIAGDGTIAWEMPNYVCREATLGGGEIAVGDGLIQATDDICVRRSRHLRIVPCEERIG